MKYSCLRIRVIIQSLIHFILSTLNRIIAVIRNFFEKKEEIHFSNGQSVVIDYKLAEGGFSYIYCATELLRPTNSRILTPRQYALKRVQCLDDDMIRKCEKEALIHGKLSSKYCLPLYTMEFMKGGKVCYMLFPLIRGGSLRDEVTRRRLLENTFYERIRPLKERLVLDLFQGVVLGVKALHDAGFAHYDVKLENVLLDTRSGSEAKDEESGEIRSSSNIGTPVLMDFGSARELNVKLVDRRTVLNLIEEAAQNSTISYRAPELFDGGCRHGPSELNIDGKVDVWSLGCLLYALMYGSSPFEVEYRKDDGSVKIVECSQLRVISESIPFPPTNSPRGKLFGYRNEMIELIKWILIVNRADRPTIEELIEKIDQMRLKESR